MFSLSKILKVSGWITNGFTKMLCMVLDLLTGSPGEIQPRVEMGGQHLKWVYGLVGHILVPFNDPEAKKSFSASTASETASFIFD